MTPELRQARPSDAPEVAAIMFGWMRETPWLHQRYSRNEMLHFARLMIDRNWVTLALTDHVAGMLARDCDVVHALYVSEPGRGLGKRLLDHAKGCRPTLTLWTHQANTPARRFYLREGFAEVERTDGTGNDDHLPDIRFAWEQKVAA
ncbi:GNAT family N-acetyltransferase [Aliiroseovarius sp. YM-037]|uniref:GNAT family N-acetyltransferase n=1 Tax=Aliiroseovarius sp. YM-037 TaxID=3341728 RepID=UPI003A7FC8B8